MKMLSWRPGFKDWFGTRALNFHLILLMIQLFCSTCIRQRSFCAVVYLRKLSQQKVNRKLYVPVNPSSFSQKSKENDQEKSPWDLHYFSTSVAGSSNYQFSMYWQALWLHSFPKLLSAPVWAVTAHCHTPFIPCPVAKFGVSLACLITGVDKSN